jgi:hypothetical protein
MKSIQLFTLFLFMIGIFACNPPIIESGEQEESIPKPIKNGFDAALAQQLGADESSRPLGFKVWQRT